MSPLLQIRGLTKRYGTCAALDGVDLCIGRGEIWGLVGQNGAGKSTLLKIVAGLQRPDGGALDWDGSSADPCSPAFRAHLGYASERPALYPGWTVRENLAFFAGLRGLRSSASLDGAEPLGLTPLWDRRMGGLSRGQLQRAALAVAVLGDPELLLLDEPHGGLDLSVLDALADLVRERARRGRAVVMTSHVLAQVAETCSRIAVLHAGRVLATGTCDELAGLAGAPAGTLSLERIYRTLVRA